MYHVTNPVMKPFTEAAHLSAVPPSVIAYSGVNVISGKT
jgi:hypothetical protein